MKLSMRNVAKIESADLELKGITVIAGNNNTGKSTVGKSVYSLFNSMVNINSKIRDQKASLIAKFFDQKLFEDPNDRFDWLQREFHSPLHWAQRIAGYSQYSAIRAFLTDVLGEHCDEPFIDSLINDILEINNLPEDRLVKSAISVYFRRIFYGEIGNIYQENANTVIDAQIAGKTIHLKFKENVCTDLVRQIDITNEAVYLDNPFVLDKLNTSLSGLNDIQRNVIRKLLHTMEAVDNVVQQDYISEKLKPVMSQLNKVSAGIVEIGEARSYYYKDSVKGKKLNLSNLSAGLKSFVIIKMLLENGTLKERDVLILDEPEIHLHPEWQLIYAELIVLLQKAFDLTIVLTTHSQHFLEALQFFSEKYGRTDYCTYYLSQQSERGCVIQDVSSDIRQIYSQMVDPSILLDKMRCQMEEDTDE